MKTCIVKVTTYCQFGRHRESLYGAGVGFESCVMTEENARAAVRAINRLTHKSASAWIFESEADALKFARARYRWVDSGAPFHLPAGTPIPKLLPTPASDLASPWFLRKQAA